MQISVQIGLNWNWPTGTELGKKFKKGPKSITKNLLRPKNVNSSHESQHG